MLRKKVIDEIEVLLLQMLLRSDEKAPAAQEETHFMRIAVVAPSSVPFTIGGLEKFAWCLVEAINETTDHQAELIKIPMKEQSLGQIFCSYARFFLQNLNHFDVIISTKYPSWMIKHPYHIVYMTHPLRGVYDTYTGRVDWKGYFLESPFKFAGIYMRKFVQFCDALGLAPGRIVAYYAISRTVKQRANYFPTASQVAVLYPPSPLYKREIEETMIRSTPGPTLDGSYFFTVSRLDGPKRIDLIVQAMNYIPGKCNLIIAGEGPCDKYLRTLASHDERIKFLGNINEDQLKHYYAGALAVIFAPFQEDYGLVTVEAMSFKKPVITLTDSGGPTELVTPGENGYIVDPDPKALAEKMNYYLAHPDQARRHGEEGYHKIKSITWPNLVQDLLKDHDYVNAAFETEGERRKVTVLSTYTVYPSRGGGQERIYNIYRFLSFYYEITILSFNAADKPFQRNQISPHCLEISIPVSSQHASAQWEIQKEFEHTITDILMSKLASLTTKYTAILNYYLRHSDLVIASHPFLYPLIKRIRKNQLFIYEAHNVEYHLKKNFIPATEKGRWLLAKVKQVEGRACQKSDVVFVTSSEEQKTLSRLYNLEPKKTFLAPNGVDTTVLVPPSEQERN
ncbi:glycosyltransferase family 4 protein, partial [candidate division CSSED10-310 bacterium]